VEGQSELDVQSEGGIGKQQLLVKLTVRILTERHTAARLIERGCTLNQYKQSSGLSSFYPISK